MRGTGSRKQARSTALSSQNASAASTGSTLMTCAYPRIE
jgi:hypothetical protein